MNDIDYGRLLRVAAMGAIAAVVADFAYSNYGEELRGLLEQAMELLNQTNNAPNQPGPVGGV